MAQDIRKVLRGSEYSTDPKQDFLDSMHQADDEDGDNMGGASDGDTDYGKDMMAEKEKMSLEEKPIKLKDGTMLEMGEGTITLRHKDGSRSEYELKETTEKESSKPKMKTLAERMKG